MTDQRLLGFSLAVEDGHDFHCLNCVITRTNAWAAWRDQRALAVVEFPELQRYSWTYNFARALRVVQAGPFGSRLYSIEDDGVDDEVRREAEAKAGDAGLLLTPSRPIPIRPDFLVCADCHRVYQRTDDEAAAAILNALQKAESAPQSLLGKVLYWLSKWPWLTAAVLFFIFAALLPPFVWYLRTPLLLGLSFVALVSLFFARLKIRSR